MLLTSSIEEAYVQLDKAEKVTLTLLDVNVHGVKSYSLAEELLLHGAPVIFATGYSLLC